MLKHRWSELVGPQVAEHCEYVSFEGGALTLRAHSTSWATQLKFLAPAMLGRFAADLGDGIVLEITVLNPGGPRFKTGPKRVPGAASATRSAEREDDARASVEKRFWRLHQVD